MEDNKLELESFRRQWRAEVTARSKGNEGPSDAPASSSESSGTAQARRRSAAQPPNAARRFMDEEEALDPKTYHDLDDKEDAFRLGVEGDSSKARDIALKGDAEPRSALEHFEKAIEREDKGSLGESLNHYRKAYRLDPSIDKTYRAKHYPPSKARQVSSSSPPTPVNVNPSNASVTVPNTAHHSQDGNFEAPTTTTALILSFGDLPIPASPPPTEASPAPYSPFSTLPSEILIEILLSLAILDIAAFTRLSLVCKRLAFLALTEDRRIWRRIVSGPEFGLGGMHFTSPQTVAIPRPSTPDIRTLSLTSPPDDHHPPPTHLPLTLSPPTYPTYHHLFRHHPRIRFSGLYISTVNYVRPGAASPAQVTWNTPVHIVTYYRYLRFFRDGSLLSLLTTAEPADVVHHLTPENCAAARSGAGAGLPAVAAAKGALRGRWRLVGDPRVLPAGLMPTKDGSTDVPGDVLIETEGTSAKYTYKMHLALRPTEKKRSGGGGGGKLVWRGFWSYNHLTDDWGEFGLRNDRPFFWSRVRSYGLGA